MSTKLRYKIAFFVLCCGFVLLTANSALGAKATKKTIVVKMATLAPDGTPWHEYLKEIAAEWHTASNGQVKIRIYPGGVAGDEGDMIRKIRISQLHGGAFSIGGLNLITADINALAIPMAIDTWETLDRVLVAVGSRIEQRIEEKGFVMLNWADIGWVRFFVPESDASIDAVRRAKLFVWSGDDRTVEIWKKGGFNAVPLSVTDILPGLQSGMINAFNSTAIVALANQWFAFTPYMIDMPWVPLVGATVVSKKTWLKIPETLRPKLQEIANQANSRLRQKVRRLEAEAVLEMQKRGLNVIKPTDEQLQRWREVLVGTYPKLRGKIIPQDVFDIALTAARKKVALDGEHGKK
jgi:TRAP-type C4-dicarboxylate transport system substrate-binding protein